MQNQGYRNWRTCFAEHIIVGLGGIRIAYALGDSIGVFRIRNNYINNRKFIYLKMLERNIQKFEENRIDFKSIDTYIPDCSNRLMKISLINNLTKNEQ